MLNQRRNLTKTVISNDEVNNFLIKPKQPLYNDKYHHYLYYYYLYIKMYTSLPN